MRTKNLHFHKLGESENISREIPKLQKKVVALGIMGVVRHTTNTSKCSTLYLFALSSLKMLIFSSFYRTKFLCPHALSYQIINYAQHLINKLYCSKPNFPKMIYLITVHFSHMVRNYTFHSFHSVHKYEKLKQQQQSFLVQKLWSRQWNLQRQ